MLSCSGVGGLTKVALIVIVIVTLDLVDSKMRSCYFGPGMDVDHTHIMDRQQWFRSALEKIKTGCPGRVKATSPIDFSCAKWDSFTAGEFADMATTPNIIGEQGRKCRISAGGSSTFCKWYVKYQIDGIDGDEWTGLTYNAQPGGSGCCKGCDTALEAGSWLKEHHKTICCDQ
ncbi:uncharacterized protein [Asterias amurensis]|uniref:uncharacterized protein n=1 Tax=Asterias amurensis TaxID=7602 RepID=UPI003AB480B3